MTNMDRAAIVFTIAITVIGASIGFAGLSNNDSSNIVSDTIPSTIPITASSSDVTEPIPEPTLKPTTSKTYTVDIPEGTSFVGCHQTDECYIPSSITVNTRDTITWINSDVAAHTVTSGIPSNGPDGLFESSLFPPNATFQITMTKPGNYDYFCLVHPWMVGTITVN